MLLPEGFNGSKTLALWTPSGILLLGFTLLVAYAAPKGLDRRPLDPFGRHLIMVMGIARQNIYSFSTNILQKDAPKGCRGDRKAPCGATN